MEELHYTAVCHLSYVLENNLQFTEPILKPLKKKSGINLHFVTSLELFIKYMRSFWDMWVSE